MSPLISVIIPCYNRAQYLPEVINSLIAQSHENWECIIVNDGSTDNTKEVVQNICRQDNRFIYIGQDNQGPSAARNAGLKAADGLYIQFLDSDDKLEFSKLETHALYLENNPSIDIVYGDARYFTNENKNLRAYGINKSAPWIKTRWDNPPDRIIEKLIKYNIMPISSQLIRSDVFTKTGYFNIDLDSHEDWEFWIRCAVKNCNIVFHDAQNSLALIRMHEESLTNNTIRMQETILEMRNKIGCLLTEPSLKLLNFKLGISQISLMHKKDIPKQTLKLLKTNFTPRTSQVALYFLFSSLPPNWFKEIYTKITPWPLQKLLSNIFKLP